MNHTATIAAGLATPPDPARDRNSQPVPARIAEILDITGILSAYGRHLADTIEHRAVWRGFATIAQFFGTAVIAVILPQLRRGIMRAVALQRVLLARRRDLAILAPRVHAPRAAAPPAPPLPEPPPESPGASAAEPPPAAAPSAQQPARPVRRGLPQGLLSLDTMPSMEDIEAEVRRRPVGQTIADICRDLGIAPALCEGGFWNRLFDAIRCYRGNLGNVVLDMRRREKLLEQEQDRHRTLGVPEQSREGVRRVLGFFIGEPLVDPYRPVPESAAPAAMAGPCAPVAVAATGPP
ncbi:MAG TPA: hypothetical protein VND19_08015 [Acetobacteraceae bacterium]|nr:hypothetical protein [Acetobacteraceae bacterium]